MIGSRKISNSKFSNNRSSLYQQSEFVNAAVWPARQDRKVHSSVRGTFLFRVGVELTTLEDTTLDEAMAQRDALLNGSSNKAMFMMRLYSVCNKHHNISNNS